MNKKHKDNEVLKETLKVEQIRRIIVLQDEIKNMQDKLEELTNDFFKSELRYADKIIHPDRICTLNELI